MHASLRKAVRGDGWFARRSVVRGIVTARLVCAALIVGGGSQAQAAGSMQATASIKDTICRFIDQSAARSHLPASFLTRLIWNESSFRTDVVSSAGAQGVAQFMPSTAAERGLADPFDPEEAIGKSAELLSDLDRQFGNLGLAAAAYNAGPARVSAWLDKRASLPLETQIYVLRITGHSADDWASARFATNEKTGPQAIAPTPTPGRNCLAETADLVIHSNVPPPLIFAPWGVQLAASFSRAAALAAFARNADRYRRVIGDVQPMIIGSRLLSRGFAPFYRVRIPEATRAAANRQCNLILSAGGACVAMRS
jgi:Transglycosylase SLT domain/SPOR domain